MKDLTHYFNSPPQQEKSNESIKTPEDENYKNCINEDSKKIKKRKKRKSKLNTEDVGLPELKKKGVKDIFRDNVLSGTNIDFRKSSLPLNNQLLCLKTDLENSERISDELKLDENINIEKKSYCDQNQIDCEKMNVSVDSNLSNSGSKHKRKREKSCSETEPKKKIHKDLKDKLKTVSNDHLGNYADISKLTDSQPLTKDFKNSAELEDAREKIIRKFVGIKLKLIRSSSESPDKYEIDKSKRKSKKSSKVKKNLELAAESEMEESVDIFKSEGKRSKHSKENKKHKSKKKKHNLATENITEDNCTSESKKCKNANFNKLTDSEESALKSTNNDLIVCSNESNDVERPESEKRNSLFKYYTKIDKATFQASRTNEKIEVKAVIHTPPILKKKSPCINNDINEDLPKITKKKHSRKKILNEVDEITVLSSEIITILDEDSCQTEEDLVNNVANSVVSNVQQPSKLDTPLKQGIPWKMRVSLSSSKSQHVNSDESNLSCSDENNSSSGSNNLRRALSEDNKIDSSSSAVKKGSSYNCSDVGNSCDDVLDISDEYIDITKTINETIMEVPRKKMDDSKPKKTNGIINNNVSKSASGKSCERKKTCGADLMAKFLGLSPKETPKPIIDQAVLKARQKFLESGVPDVIRQKIDNCQSDKILALPAPFPKISHVQQRNPNHIVWNLPAPSMSLQPSPFLDSDSLHPKWTLIMSKSLVSPDDTDYDSAPMVPTVDRKRNFKQIKKDVSVLNVKEVWKSVQEMKAASESVFDVWPEVYKPRKDSDFIGNCDNIQKLKSWMECFRNNRLDLQDGESSGAEFVDSDSEDRASFSSTCIISGPNGCGKTSAVFAVANELGYKVFEVNASSNRNGKKILTDLSEATQSHQVEHSQAMANFFTQGKVKDKEKKKRKKKRKENKQEQSSSKKRSLILIEDADLLFNDKDEGFIPAISTLAGSSKRPLILIVNDIKAPHLVKLFEVNQLKLSFNRPSAAKLESWLQLISLANGMKLEPYAAQKLVQWSECDVRKSLLQLQLLVQSNLKSKMSWPGISDAPVWISAVSGADKEKVVSKENSAKSKAIIREQLKSTIRLAQSLITYDLLSYSAALPLNRIKNPSPAPCKIRPVASTSLVDCSESLNGNNLASDIADYLYGSVTTCTPSVLRNQIQARKTDEALLSALPYYTHCSHDAVFVDYLPTLRLFGRAETIRLALHTKRTNRFFNYLNGLGVNASDSCIKYMCDTFS